MHESVDRNGRMHEILGRAATTTPPIPLEILMPTHYNSSNTVVENFDAYTNVL
jgi:hypothetical protein